MKRYIKSAILSLSDEDYAIQYDIASDPNTSPETLQELSTVTDYSHVHPIQRIVAENPSTSPETLRELSKVARLDVRSCVVRNLNTPEDVLRDMANDSDDWVGRPPMEILTGLAQNPNTPTDVLTHLCDGLGAFEHWQVARHLANNPSTPIDVLIQLSKDLEDDVRAYSQQALFKRKHLQ